MSDSTKRQTYGLMTAVSMIVGIVIGSGIYFKADDILLFSGGNLGLALLSLAVASSGIIFGALSLSELAQRTTASGGIANYMEKFVHPAWGAAFGFFQAFVYLPSLAAVVCWVAAIYTGQLLRLEFSLEEQIVLGFVYLTGLMVMNVFSRRLAGFFQTLSTWVKVIPLLVVAALGLFWSGGQQPTLPSSYELIPVHDVGWGWLSALVPLAFAYDGWFIVANIAPELKDSAKNLPRALFIGPAIILSLYMLYLYGLTTVLGESYVMSVGNDAVQAFLSSLLSDYMVNVFLLIIVISVLGVANGILLGCMRLPQALAERGWLQSERLAFLNPTYQLSIASSVLVHAVTSFWLGLHYFLMKTDALPGSDISELAVVFNGASLMILYLTILKLYRQGVIGNRLTGLVAPLLAIFGTIMLLVGSLLTNFWLVSSFMLVCLLSCGLGYAFYRKRR